MHFRIYRSRWYAYGLVDGDTVANRKKYSYQRLYKYVLLYQEIVRVLLVEMVCDRTVDLMDIWENIFL